MAMLLLLPICSFALCYLWLFGRGLDSRYAFLAAATVWGSALVLFVEGLSLAHLLMRGPVAVFWTIFCTACLYWGTSSIRAGIQRLRNGIPKTRARILTMGISHQLLVAGVSLVLFLVAVTAFLSPPNTWDAMEYHLPRIVFWMSNHSVQFYPTPDYSQLIFAPWAEYATMNVDLLWGGDRFVNFIEFFSLCGSLVGISLLAKLLGAGPRGQLLAVVICATIPSGVLEASGSMNTYVVSFWIISVVCFLLSWKDNPDIFNTIFVGLSSGLALLTKGTAYVFLPFFVLVCWWMCSSARRILFLKNGAGFLLLILVLNGPQYFRCYALTGSPLGQPFAQAVPRLHLTVDRITLRGTLANALRNISVHLATPSQSINSHIERFFRSSIRSIGADPDDPQTNWLGDPFRMGHFSTSETLAGNPVHLALLFFSISLVTWNRRKKLNRELVWFTVGCVAAFFFFSQTLRWHLWMARLQLPLFVLGSAVAGIVLERFFTKKAASILCLLFISLALFFASTNSLRSLVPWSRVENVYHPRERLYFNDQHAADADANIAAADALNALDCQNVAIDAYTDQPEIRHSPRSHFIYPILGMIQASRRNRRVYYSGVENLTTRYALENSATPPCAVICLDCAKAANKWAEYRTVGNRASVFDYIVVFSAAGVLPNSGGIPGLGSREDHTPLDENFPLLHNVPNP